MYMYMYECLCTRLGFFPPIKFCLFSSLSSLSMSSISLLLLFFHSFFLIEEKEENISGSQQSLIGGQIKK